MCFGVDVDRGRGGRGRGGRFTSNLVVLRK